MVDGTTPMDAEHKQKLQALSMEVGSVKNFFESIEMRVRELEKRVLEMQYSKPVVQPVQHAETAATKKEDI